LKETVEDFSKLLPLKRRPAMRHALLAAAIAFKFKLAAITIAHVRVGMTASAHQRRPRLDAAEHQLDCILGY
jgi:hypothetical protein